MFSPSGTPYSDRFPSRCFLVTSFRPAPRPFGNPFFSDATPLSCRASVAAFSLCTLPVILNAWAWATWSGHRRPFFSPRGTFCNLLSRSSKITQRNWAFFSFLSGFFGFSPRASRRGDTGCSANVYLSLSLDDPSPLLLIRVPLT